MAAGHIARDLAHYRQRRPARRQVGVEGQQCSRLGCGVRVTEGLSRRTDPVHAGPTWCPEGRVCSTHRSITKHSTRQRRTRPLHSSGLQVRSEPGQEGRPNQATVTAFVRLIRTEQLFVTHESKAPDHIASYQDEKRARANDAGASVGGQVRAGRPPHRAIPRGPAIPDRGDGQRNRPGAAALPRPIRVGAGQRVAEPVDLGG